MKRVEDENYFARWYRRNKERWNRLRKQRYHGSKRYRQRVLATNRRSRARQRRFRKEASK